MRFGLVHRVMTDALAALGVLSLVASGQFPQAMNIAFCVSLLLAVALKEPWRHRASERHVDTILVVLLIVTQVARGVFTSASVLDLLIEFAVGLQIVRVATRKGAAHDQQVIVLALLHLIAGTVVGGGLGYGLCFLGLLVVTPGALVLSHLRREVEGNYRQGARDRTGLPVDVPRILRSKRVVGRQFIAVTCLLSVPILLFTILLFILFPRVGLSLLLLQRPKGGRMIGFSGKVDLGQIGTLRSDPTIALRIHYDKLPAKPPPRRILHLRGTALDHYDGRSWTQSMKGTHRIVAQGGAPVPVRGYPRDVRKPSMRIDLEPIEPPVLFLARGTRALRLAPAATIGHGTMVRVEQGVEGEYRYSAPNDHGVRYALYLNEDDRPTFLSLRDSERKRYLSVPAKLPPRVAELAQAWTKGAKNDFERARRIEKQLRVKYRYDLGSPSGEADHPLDHFLFESKRGHCEYFSTAMAIMLRTVGVPTRNVTGFIGGTYNKYGRFYAVRQGDAHSWVEAYMPGRGWVTFDPTPPGAAVPQSDIDTALSTVRDLLEAASQRWNHEVLGYDLRRQGELLERYGPRGRMPHFTRRRKLLLGAVGLIAVCLWWLRKRRKPEAADERARRKKTREAAQATGMYQQLEKAMSALGIARGASVPPLRHAIELEEAEHPLAEEILALTRRYLAARYGDQPLSREERRECELRIKKLKMPPPTRREAA